MDPAFSYSGLKLSLNKVTGETEWHSSPLIEQQSQFAREMDHMAACVLQNKIPYTPGEEELQDHKVMEAIYAAARAGKVITLEKIEGIDVFRGQEPSFA